MTTIAEQHEPSVPEDVQCWTVFEAGRYQNGKLIESLDARYNSSGKHIMVRVEDYNSLRAQLDTIYRQAEESADYWCDKAVEKQRRIAELEQDAKRYRFWRKYYNSKFILQLGGVHIAAKFDAKRPKVEPLKSHYEQLIDEAIDAAIDPQPAPSQSRQPDSEEPQ